MEQQDNKRVIISGVIAVAILVLLVGGVMVAKSKQDSSEVASSKLAANTQDAASTTDTTADTSNSSASSTAAASSTAYKDGTYTASGSYNTPESVESISVTVTLKGDVVSAVSATADPQSSESREYQQLFLSGYKSLVVGKKIDSISLSRVSGSSLTSRGFNNAIQQIESDAKV